MSSEQTKRLKKWADQDRRWPLPVEEAVELSERIDRLGEGGKAETEKKPEPTRMRNCGRCGQPCAPFGVDWPAWENGAPVHLLSCPPAPEPGVVAGGKMPDSMRADPDAAMRTKAEKIAEREIVPCNIGKGAGTHIEFSNIPLGLRWLIQPPGAMYDRDAQIAALREWLASAITAAAKEHAESVDRQWRTWGSIEVMLRNVNVDSRIRELEKRLATAEKERDEAVEALSFCAEALELHDQWCGHRNGAPGHAIINHAERAASRILGKRHGMVHIAQAAQHCGQCGGPIDKDGPLTLCTRCAMSKPSPAADVRSFLKALDAGGERREG